MKIARYDDITWEYEDELNVTMGYNSNLPNNDYADIYFAKIAANSQLSAHYHDRPDPSGYISFHFFQGGHIEVILSDAENQIIKTEKPFHVTFEHMEKHGIHNLSDTEVIFEIISAPKYAEGEERIL